MFDMENKAKEKVARTKKTVVQEIEGSSLLVKPKLIQRVIFDWMLLVGFYVPFLVFLLAKHRVYMDPLYGLSLSGIGWRIGDFGMLAYYTLFVAGFLMYQMFVFLKNRATKDVLHYTIMILMTVGVALLVIGSFMPISGGHFGQPLQPNTLMPNIPLSVLRVTDELHTIFCLVGPLFSVLSIALMLYTYCRESKTDLIIKLRVIIPCLFITLFGVLGMLTLAHWVAAVYSVCISFMVLVYLHYLNICYELTPRAVVVHDKKLARRYIAMTFAWILILVIVITGFMALM